MMNSLFTSFDPMNSIFKTNYSVFMLILWLPLLNNMNNTNNRYNNTMKGVKNFMLSELMASINNKNQNGKNIILVSIFFMVLMMNVMGLLPYVFTLTAHMTMTMSLAFPLWLSFILFNLKKNMNQFLSHLIPLGTPMMLSNFMVLIEMTSLFIRPITLSVRLAANMTAGHILMALSSSPILIMSPFSLILIILIVLELAVAIIQSYVFVILLSMYLSETY